MRARTTSKATLRRVTEPPQPHLLLVAWGFPPGRSGGVYRALAMANAFAADGWQVTVLTASREAFVRYTGTDPTLEDQVDPRVEVVRVPFRWEARETDLRRYSWWRVRTPALWRQVHSRQELVRFPERGYGPWRAALEQAALDVHARHPVDLVLATANPHVAFTAAWRLYRDAGVPYVLDYRDAWLLDVFSGERLHGPRSRPARWERRLVDAATEVWFVNEPIRAWHAQLYPEAADRMHVVANGFDPSLADDVDHGFVAAHESADAATRPLVLGYLGTVTAKVPMAELLAGWQLARDTSPELADAQLRLHGYLGYFHTPRADLLKLVEGGTPAVSYEGPVGRTRVAQVYAGFDVLLLVLGAGRYVTSGKVYEYLATGLPIVSVHDPGNAVADVLAGHPLWFPVDDLTPASVAAALTAAATAARRADPGERAAALAYAAPYRRDRQLAPRLAALRSAVGRVVAPRPEPSLSTEAPS
jgi:glycosyltransferase involved in cell wall biosynthesis